MALDYDMLMALPPLVTEHVVTARDTILYALGVGATELRHIYEDGLATLPTMAVVVAHPGFFAKDPRYGLTWQKILHGEQSIELHRPLPATGRFIGSTTIDQLVDRGADKGAIMLSSRTIHNADTGEHIATTRATTFLRGDGGFGPRGAAKLPQPHAIPDDRAPEIILRLPTGAGQAALYRLSGDYNPLHIDPAVARSAGFDRPILHGLCTFGVIGRGLLGALCAGEGARVRRMDARFSSPLYPGETIRLEVWNQGSGQAAFRAYSDERDLVVLNNGHLVFD